jgi:hypothetical protein
MRRLAISPQWRRGASDGTLGTRQKGLAGALAGAVIAASVGLPATSAWAATVFTSGTFVLPEGIIPATGGGYLVSDADNGAIYLVPATGGAPSAQQPTNFRTFGEVQLPAGYTSSGTYLAYGTNATSTNGIAALVGTSGIAAPTTVINAPTAFYTTAVVAPSSYGSIAQGSVVLGNNPGGVGAPTSTIVTLNSNLSGTTTFATLTGIDAFGVGFAPASFGSHAGQMFVSDVATGNIYTVSPSGQATLFATLPLPAGFSQPGLRQFAWAPPGSFGAYSGDLFVSIAAQNGGGGSNGEIDVLDATGQTVALYAVGTALVPVDPRGLLFIGNNELLVANADPGIVQASPSDFLPAAEVLPEPGTLGVLLAGLIGLTITRRRRFVS